LPLDPIALLKELIALPGPPGQEDAVRDAVAAHATALGCATLTDERGNLIIAAPGQSAVPERVDILVMAHLDEIAMMVERYDEAGNIRVVSLGGLFPWKCGESPVSILAPGGPIPGILGFGSIHTSSPESRIARAKDGPLTWDMARVFTGMSGWKLEAAGVRPGTRVVLGPERRTVTEFGSYIAGPFLDDRADLVAMLLAIEAMQSAVTAAGPVGKRRKKNSTPHPDPLLGKEREPDESTSTTGHPSVAFAATAAEEVGGHGSLYLMRRMQPDVAIALEIGPRVPESHFPLNGNPTVWVNDAYSSVQARDLELIAQAAASAGIAVHWQALSRGGSDASCGAANGMVARPITLAFAAENSHGYEITHRDSIGNLAKLLGAVLGALRIDATRS
jgi:putative aminopeptidase FrvX